MERTVEYVGIFEVLVTHKSPAERRLRKNSNASLPASRGGGSPLAKGGASVETPSKPASVVVICPFLKSRRLISAARPLSLDGEEGGSYHALLPSEKQEGGQESPLQSIHQQADLYKSQEAEKLCGAIHLRVLYTRIVYLEKIRPSTYFGSGFLEELKNVLTDTGADLLYS